MTKREKMFELLDLFAHAKILDDRLNFCDQQVFKISEAARLAIIAMIPEEDEDALQERETLAEQVAPEEEDE